MTSFKCICKPVGSGKNRRCIKCYPPKWKVTKLSAGKTGHDPIRPAEQKQHNAPKMSEFGQPKGALEISEVVILDEDPYEDYDYKETEQDV